MNQQRKICIITGANKGIGYETALTLGITGWEVVLACRSFARGNQAVMALNGILRQLDPRAGGNGVAVFMELDLASLSSIDNFMLGFKKLYAACNLLICNAGVRGSPYRTTAEGYELQFGVNYLGHAALIRQMLPLLQKTSDARVIQVSSRAHKRATLKSGEFLKAAYRTEDTYNPWKAYAQSKLFQVLFTHKAQRILGSDSLRFYAVDPGVTATDLFLAPVPAPLKTLLRPIAAGGARIGVLRTPKRASDTVTHLALKEPAPPGGSYWADRKQREPNSLVYSESLLDEVWQGTAELLKANGLKVE